MGKCSRGKKNKRTRKTKRIRRSRNIRKTKKIRRSRKKRYMRGGAPCCETLKPTISSPGSLKPTEVTPLVKVSPVSLPTTSVIDSKVERVENLSTLLNGLTKISGVNTFNYYILKNGSIVILLGDPHAGGDRPEGLDHHELRCSNQQGIPGWLVKQLTDVFFSSEVNRQQKIEEVHSINYFMDNSPDILEHETDISIESFIKYLINLTGVDFFIETTPIREYRSIHPEEESRFNTPLINTFTFFNTGERRILYENYQTRIHWIDLRKFIAYSGMICLVRSLGNSKKFVDCSTQMGNKMMDFFRDNKRLSISIFFYILIWGVNIEIIKRAILYLNTYIFMGMYESGIMADGRYVNSRIEDLQYYVDNFHARQRSIRSFLNKLFVQKDLPTDMIKILLHVFDPTRNMNQSLFSKQLLKLEDDIQIKCVAFISWQAYISNEEQLYTTTLSTNIGWSKDKALRHVLSLTAHQPNVFPFVTTMLIDLYSLLRMLYYLGYGKEYLQLNDREDISHIQSGYNISVVYGGEGGGCPNRNPSNINPFNVNYHPLQSGLGICHNNLRGHASGPSFFIQHLLHADVKKYSENNSSLVKDPPDDDAKLTDCVYVRDSQLGLLSLS